jgi:uroporphyrinogen decarboxylase
MRTMMTSLQRVRAALRHEEADRVPYFLLLTVHGAQELGMTVKEYLSRAEYVVEGQLRLRRKYQHDCFTVFPYQGIEVEAWKGSIRYLDDRGPVIDEPCIAHPRQILGMEVPRIDESPIFCRMTEIIEVLSTAGSESVPIVGGVMSPFSLPMLQMGLDNYRRLRLEEPSLFVQLMRINEELCVAWANAQLQAGASIVCYFDPLSSPSLTPREEYLTTGYAIARRTLARIHGPTALIPICSSFLPLDRAMADTGLVLAGTEADEDLVRIKSLCGTRLSLMGNLDFTGGCRWTPRTAACAVKDAIGCAGPGGGFILANGGGEVSYQVTEEVLLAVGESVHTWGSYPLQWIPQSRSADPGILEL